MKISVGVPCHNEEKNIRRVIESVLGQEGAGVEVGEVIVVASGCTDQTADIVNECASNDARVKLILEPERRGKPSAVNIIFKEAKNEIIVMTDGDLRPEKDAFSKLLPHFENPNCGIVGGYPLPINGGKGFWGHTADLMWDMHHVQFSRDADSGKLTRVSGYLYAIRKGIVDAIPKDAVNEDSYLAWMVKSKGYSVEYEPGAKVYIKNPDNKKDFIGQRRRVAFGHFNKKEYEVATMSLADNLKIIFSSKFFWKNPFYSFGAFLLESYARHLAKKDIKSGKGHTNWKKIDSSKEWGDESWRK